ncbi:polysaccharide lyase family 7 protein [Mariniflexile jejuense]|uniref:Polysaccharide lyase family 7 protein n=1 Tax=Mariniflexile jejuense TaxID=1173582 RepID=A0ABW3JK92_9FLAO
MSKADKSEVPKYPSDFIPFMDEFTILCGDGKSIKDLVNVEHKDFFYVSNDGKTDWVVYKTPNSGITSKNSSNTRTELGQKKHWKTEEGGKLTGTLKVMHVSTSGDARVAASYAVVVGQIHGTEGHENEPLKIFYKKFQVIKKVLFIGIMKLIQKAIIPNVGIIQPLFGEMTCLLLG